MSEQELYDIARQRVEGRYRRWKFWTFNLGGLIMSVAGVILLADTAYSGLGVAIMLVWGAIFVTHTILISMANSRDDDITKEVDKLRTAVYEKPKRLELGEDGELVYEDWEGEESKRQTRGIK